MTQLATVPGGLTREQMGTEEFRESAVHMAEEFQAGAEVIRANILSVWEQTRRLNAAFPSGRGGAGEFAIGFEVQHERRLYGTHDAEGDIDKLVKRLNRDAWKRITDQIGIKNVMSVAKRREFEKQLESGDLPDITPGTIVAILFNMADQARDFAVDAAKEVFNILLPSRHEHTTKYKVNSAFQIGPRVVLAWFVEQMWGSPKFRASHSREGELAAIDNMFHVLDGQGIVRDGRPPIIEAIAASSDGTGETAYFRFRCCKNRNLHLEFKRMDLVKKLNALGAGETVLGNEPPKPPRRRRTAAAV